MMDTVYLSYMVHHHIVCGIMVILLGKRILQYQSNFSSIALHNFDYSKVVQESFFEICAVLCFYSLVSSL